MIDAFDRPTSSAPGDTAWEGDSGAASRANHRHAREAASVAVAATRFRWDEFTATGATGTFTFTYTPLPDSLHVYLGTGTVLRENVDYTLSGKTLSVLSAAGMLNGDIVTGRYAYFQGAVNNGTWLTSSNGGTAVQPALPSGTSAGDLAIIFLGKTATNTLTLNGWTQRALDQVTHAAHNNTYTYQHYVLTKVLAGGDTMPAIAFINNDANIYVCAVAHGGAVLDQTAVPTVTADSLTGPDPALTNGTVAVRAWLTLSDLGTISAPAGRTAITSASVGGQDVDMYLFVEADTTAASATNSVTAGWVANAVGVTP